MEWNLKDWLFVSPFISLKEHLMSGFMWALRHEFNTRTQCGKEENMSLFTGSGVAIITPMNEDKSVNFDKLGAIIDDQIKNHTDAIIICGTTGEASTLTHEEHLDCIRFCSERVNKRIPVIAGTGSNCTETAVFLSREAQKAGVDGLLVVTPYYNKATQNGLYEHYKEIAASVDLPIIMYNVPGRTGCNILAPTAAKIFKDVDNIVGIKEATGNISQVAKLMSLTNGEIDLYSGNDDQIVPILSLGGKGVISVLANVAPQKTHDIVASYLAGEVGKSAKLQLEAIELIDALFCEVNPIPVKTAMNLLGWEAGPLRRPLSPMEPANVERLRAAMKGYGIL